jgi:hypothetical protein
VRGPKQAGLLARDDAANLQPAPVPERQNPFVLVNYSPTICLNPPFLILGQILGQILGVEGDVLADRGRSREEM